MERGSGAVVWLCGCGWTGCAGCMVDVIVIGDFCGLEEVEAGVGVMDIGGLLAR